MRRSGVVPLVLLVLAAIGVAPAAHAAFSAGTIEFTPSLAFARNSFSFSGNDAGSNTILTASGELGYFVNPNFELGGGLLVDYQSAEAPGFPSQSATSLGLVGGVQYNFTSGGNTIPFVRGAVGIATNSGSGSAGDQTTLIAPIVSVGMRVLVGSSASVNFGVGYQHRSDAFGIQDLSSNSFGLDVGVSLILRQGR